MVRGRLSRAFSGKMANVPRFGKRHEVWIESGRC